MTRRRRATLTVSRAALCEAVREWFFPSIPDWDANGQARIDRAVAAVAARAEELTQRDAPPMGRRP